jgi:NAD(P)H-dependent flavin oxidoreductase YrpB (nitropropane dioxygenase family)
MKTALCDLLGIEHPIVAAPMGPDLTGPELVAAVSNAGGLGILQASSTSRRYSARRSAGCGRSPPNRSG